MVVCVMIAEAFEEEQECCYPADLLRENAHKFLLLSRDNSLNLSNQRKPVCSPFFILTKFTKHQHDVLVSCLFGVFITMM